MLTIDLTLTLLNEEMLTALSRILTGTVPYYKGKESVKNIDDEYIKVSVGGISRVPRIMYLYRKRSISIFYR